VHRLILAAAISVFSAISASADLNRATEDEAIEMIVAATDQFEQDGLDTLIEAINAGAYLDRDLYVLALRNDGVMLANPVATQLVGTDTSELRDRDGLLLAQAFIEQGEAGGGWVAYKWEDPLTGEFVDKAAYVLPIGIDTVIAAGIYSDS